MRKPAKQMEMLWRGAKSFGDTADVFTSNFPTGACILQFINAHQLLCHPYMCCGCFLNSSQRVVCILCSTKCNFCPSGSAAAKQRNAVLEQGKHNSVVDRVT